MVKFKLSCRNQMLGSISYIKKKTLRYLIERESKRVNQRNIGSTIQ